MRVGRVTTARLTALGKSRGRTSTQLTKRLSTLYKVSTPTPPNAQDAGSSASSPSATHASARPISSNKRLIAAAKGSNFRISRLRAVFWFLSVKTVRLSSLFTSDG